MITRALTAALLLALVLTPASSGAVEAPAKAHLLRAFLDSIEDAQLHGTVTPPGADNAHATTEIAAYDDLVRSARGAIGASRSGTRSIGTGADAQRSARASSCAGQVRP